MDSFGPKTNTQKAEVRLSAAVSREMVPALPMKSIHKGG